MQPDTDNLWYTVFQPNLSVSVIDQIQVAIQVEKWMGMYLSVEADRRQDRHKSKGQRATPRTSA